MRLIQPEDEGVKHKRCRVLMHLMNVPKTVSSLPTYVDNTIQSLGSVLIVSLGSPFPLFPLPLFLSLPTQISKFQSTTFHST
jgi:hypothetical protein